MKSALVTGGSSGIGLAIARALHGEGYGLTLAARKVERLEAAGAELGAATMSVDVRDEDACRGLVEAHVERFGGLDVLVNSAGVGIAGRIGDLTTKAWDLQQDVNLRGTFLMTRESLPHLRATRGYVLNLASIAGTVPTPSLSGYGASKAAVISFTRSLLREEADNGVRATALCPGFVDTPMAAWTGLEAEEMIRPEDCAELALALLRLSPAARVPVVVVERAADET